IYRRPILCVWASGRELPQLLPAGTEQAPVIDSRGPRYSQALDEIMTRLDRERRGSPISERLAPEPTFEPRNPYKGLHAFTLQDRRDFFGREAFIKEMITLLRDTLLPATSGSPGKRLLTIVGPSGSGKSSIAMAGLLPQLQDSAIEGSDSWIYLDPLLPGKQPLDALASTLTARFPEKGIQAVREVLGRENAFGLHQLALAIAHQGTRVVLLIDQFEELFSPDVPEAERQHFINLLVTAATEPRGPVLLILTLRADFYDRPLAYPALGQLIQQGQSTVLPMEIEDIRAVIERPALQSDVRLVFEEDLVGDLLYEIGGQPAALPLLEFTLDQLFSHRRGHRLTRHAYQEMGGVRGALSKHAEDTYARLPSEEHLRLTRSVFMRLIQPAATGQDPIRRRASQAEFTSENEQDTHVLNEVIMAFLAARLLTTNQISGVTTLEVSHEALLREWPRLAAWTHEASEDIRLQQTISSDVAEWEQRGRPKDRLYRGTQLKESLTWLQRNIASGSEAAFLRASTARRKRERISLLVVACLILALLIPAGLLARQQLTPPTVTTLQDSGSGSLRQVIEAAPQGSTIYFAPNLKGNISLGSALEISRNLTIRGPGANLLSIGGIGSLYLILIDAGANVTFSGLTFSEPKPRQGGMINNSGSLTLDQCTIANNTELGDKLPNLPNENQAIAAGIDNTGTLILQSSIITKNTITTGTGIGGGISNDKGTVTLIKSQITDNTVKSSGQLAGGGALVNTGGKVTITSSTISGNTITGGTIGTAGGGIYSSQGTLSLAGSTVANNSVSNSTAAGLGAGILGDGSTITLTNSRVTGNKVTARGIVSGGGIEIDNGSLKLISSIVLQNSANSSNDSGLGGGINASKSAIMLTNSQVSDNTVTSNKLAGGGGIASNSSPGSITLDGSTITNNTITAPEVGGGGIISLDGKVTITNSTVSNNTARGTQGDNGGGIFDTDTLTITNSIISHNTLTSTSTSLGGGIASAGILNLSNSTVSDNTINNSNGISNGAGIAIQKPLDPKITGDTMKLTNCTISENKASGSKGSYGGGIEAEGVQGTIDFCTIYGNTAATAAGGFASGLDPKWGKPNITLKNTLIANNSAASGPDLMGTITTGGYNLLQRFSGATWNDPANKHATDLSGDKYPNLGIDPNLRVSGKVTPTHALLPNSPALNQIPPASCDIPVDQRGAKRPQQNACDIGAYEYTP
ncbi:MAG TPA: choice-of-anchor Q domain-containing protein, partial [Ktedonobacteraceae bacterium]|nr:choice-of-anchor Q domain-containing protein [Ktedonobacteraceae bacterium]